MAQEANQEINCGTPTSSLDSVCQTLRSISQIQRLYVNEASHAISVLAVVSGKDFAIERAIYKRQLEIMDTLPGFKFHLRVISLRGRELPDVVTAPGMLVFQKA